MNPVCNQMADLLAQWIGLEPSSPTPHRPPPEPAAAQPQPSASSTPTSGHAR